VSVDSIAEPFELPIDAVLSEGGLEGARIEKDVDVFRKPLDEVPAFREAGAALEDNLVGICDGDDAQRLRDGVTLSRNRIQGDKLFLYTTKTGTAVYCPLPPSLVKALNAIPENAYFFWTGLSKPKSAVGGLAAQFETPPHFGWFARWPRASFPRYLFRRTFACGSADRTGVNSLGSPECADHREALRSLGSCASGAVGSRCSAHLANS
jgi:hypothetical protein